MRPAEAISASVGVVHLVRSIDYCVFYVDYSQNKSFLMRLTLQVETLLCSLDVGRSLGLPAASIMQDEQEQRGDWLPLHPSRGSCEMSWVTYVLSGRQPCSGGLSQ